MSRKMMFSICAAVTVILTIIVAVVVSISGASDGTPPPTGTPLPTVIPTESPTAVPTAEPTAAPTVAPTLDTHIRKFTSNVGKTKIQLLIGLETFFDLCFLWKFVSNEVAPTFAECVPDEGSFGISISPGGEIYDCLTLSGDLVINTADSEIFVIDDYLPNTRIVTGRITWGSASGATISNRIETVAGGISMSLPDVTSVSFNALTAIGRDFQMAGGAVNLQHLSFPVLQNVITQFYIRNCLSLNNVSFPELETVGGEFLIEQNGDIMQSFSAPKLRRIDGPVEFNENGAERFHFPSLTNIRGPLYILRNINLVKIDFGALAEIELTTVITCNINDVLEEVRFGSLQTLDSIIVSECRNLRTIIFESLRDLSFTAATDLAAIEFTQLPSLRTISFPTLTTIEPQIGFAGKTIFVTNTAVQTINIPEVATIFGNIEIYGNDELTEVTMTKLRYLAGNLLLPGNAAFGSVDFPSLGTVEGTIQISSNIALTSVNFPVLVFLNGGFLLGGSPLLTTRTLIIIIIIRNLSTQLKKLNMPLVDRIGGPGDKFFLDPNFVPGVTLGLKDGELCFDNEIISCDNACFQLVLDSSICQIADPPTATLTLI